MSETAAQRVTADEVCAKRNALIEQYQKFVDFVAARLIKRMGLPPSLYDELCAAGYLGLVEAAERFDYKRGRDFRPFAFLRVRGAIIDSIRRISDLSGKAYRYARALQAAESLREEIHHEKSFGRRGLIAARDKEERLAKILDYAATCAFAFRLSACDAEQEIADAGDQAPTPEDVTERRSTGELLRRLVSELPEKERRIIEGYYFEDRSFVEMLDADAGLSKSWVSRLHARALDRLRARFMESLAEGTDEEDEDKEAKRE